VNSRLGWAIAVLAMAAMVAAAIWFAPLKKSAPESELVPVILTSYPGEETMPSFSPDGTQVAFTWCKDIEGKNCNIYIKQIGVEPPSRLTATPRREYGPAWSPNGEFLAFIRETSPTTVALIVVPQRGGHERVVTNIDISGREPPGPWHLGWTSDSKCIVLSLPAGPTWALFLLSLEN